MIKKLQKRVSVIGFKDFGSKLLKTIRIMLKSIGNKLTFPLAIKKVEIL